MTRTTPIRYALLTTNSGTIAHRTRTRLTTLCGLEVWSNSKQHTEWQVVDQLPPDTVAVECPACKQAEEESRLFW